MRGSPRGKSWDTLVRDTHLAPFRRFARVEWGRETCGPADAEAFSFHSPDGHPRGQQGFQAARLRVQIRRGQGRRRRGRDARARGQRHLHIVLAATLQRAYPKTTVLSAANTYRGPSNQSVTLRRYVDHCRPSHYPLGPLSDRAVYMYKRGPCLSVWRRVYTTPQPATTGSCRLRTTLLRSNVGTALLVQPQSRSPAVALKTTEDFGRTEVPATPPTCTSRILSLGRK